MYVITGGGTGLGRALVLALSARGQSVLIVGRRESVLQETAAHSPLISYLCADVSSEEGMEQIKTHLDAYPSLAALVNNAGTLGPIESLNNLQHEAWLNTLNTNLNAPLFYPKNYIPN